MEFFWGVGVKLWRLVGMCALKLVFPVISYGCKPRSHPPVIERPKGGHQAWAPVGLR